MFKSQNELKAFGSNETKMLKEVRQSRLRSPMSEEGEADLPITTTNKTWIVFFFALVITDDVEDIFWNFPAVVDEPESTIINVLCMWAFTKIQNWR